jgi:L-alanine-DL-glutamate epimerase-like enolase superfamily enzyme
MDGIRPVHIESVEVVPLRVPLDRIFRGSHYSMANRCTLITRVHTREGPTGEAYNGDECDAQATIARIITEELGPLLTGQELPAPTRLWRSMLPPTFDILRDRRLVIMAMAAVDSAAWDAVGKLLGVPLWRLWGGSRSSLPVIAIGGYYGEDDAALAREMEDYRRLGIAGCKFKVGGATPEEDARRLSVARESAGQDFILMADANQGYEIVEATRFARLVESLEVRWFEEPVGWANDRVDLHTLRMRTPIPLAAGQSEHTVSGARDLISSGAIDVCNFDASWGGGPTPWLEVASVASAFGVEMAHHEEPQIAAQLLAAVPKGTYLECFHPDRDPIFWGLLANRSGPRDGRYFLTEEPGFGLDLDETFIKRWRVDQ